MQLFAKRYPHEFSGLIMIDSDHQVQRQNLAEVVDAIRTIIAKQAPAD